MVEGKRGSNAVDIEKRIEDVAKGILFIWIGGAWALGFSLNIGLTGIALILFSSQAARKVLGLEVQLFWIIVGAIFLLSGLMQILHVNLIAIFFIAIGIMIIFRQFNPAEKKKDK